MCFEMFFTKTSKFSRTLLTNVLTCISSARELQATLLVSACLILTIPLSLSHSLYLTPCLMPTKHERHMLQVPSDKRN